MRIVLWTGAECNMQQHWGYINTASEERCVAAGEENTSHVITETLHKAKSCDSDGRRLPQLALKTDTKNNL